MRKTFLEYVAEDLLAKFGNDLSQVRVIFPNKRASLFLNEYLARNSDKPIWSPTYLTISQLFRNYGKMNVGDDIKLICDLHRVYQECTGIDETLDHFYGWGQLMLSDFDDIDKNMADADDVFRNISNIHELDDISYLTDEQKEILKRFFHNFSEDYNTELKKRFLNLWRNFGSIYHRYNEYLASEGIAYEGAVYRQVVSDEGIEFEGNYYVFVGFNMIQKVEQALFKRLAKAGKAKFYWDFDKYYLDDDQNEAGHYIRQYLYQFPNELDNKDAFVYDNLSQPKDITYISASTETMQARYISHWLKQGRKYDEGRKTAIVLCDENLLQTAIYSLPTEVKNVNITTGFPLAQSPVYSYVNALIALQTSGMVRNTDKFRLRLIAPILRHPYSMFLSPLGTELLQTLEEHHVYYPSHGELCKDEGLTLLFTDVTQKAKSQDDYNSLLLSWLLAVIKRVGVGTKDKDDVLMKESIFKMYTLLNRLYELIISGDLQVDSVTLQKFVHQLIQSSSIPFHGEPAIGVQLMGVLETRNIDFDNLLILSCNEGNMPKGINDSSFIPYSIRKAFDLTTVDHKVAIYSYYFHRMLQRAKNVTILYNNSTEDGHTGEMSRFMMQLMVESNQKIKREAIQAGQASSVGGSKPVKKTLEVIDYLLSLEKLSPTAINRYLRCPLQFYYYTVAGIREKENDCDEIDNRTFGNIFHRASQLVYERIQDPDKRVTTQAIKAFLRMDVNLQQVVDQAFKEELFKVEKDGYHPEYNGLQLINRRVIMSYLQQLLAIDYKLAPFRILGVEEEVNVGVDIQIGEQSHSLQVGGYIDRLDEIADECGRRIRVVDYKTGHLPQQKIQDLDDVFSTDSVIAKHSDYYLQTILYSMIIRQSSQWNEQDLPVSPALLFIQHASAEDYDPILAFGKEKIGDVGDFRQLFWQKLKELLEEIYNEHIAFHPTSDSMRCTYCPYAKLCKL